MRDAIQACNDRAIDARGWESLQVEGHLLIDRITEAIETADICVAEISSNNSNVLFEAGFALARGKDLYLAIDETDHEAMKAWAGLGMVETIGRINYGGNAQKLADSLADRVAGESTFLMERLLSGARPREANAIFAPGVPHKFNAADRLERLLERKTHLNLLAAQDELGLAALAYYVEEIYRSSAVILHFMKPSRVRAAEYNSRVSLLAGIAHGLDLPLLMVAEEGYRPPLDYKDLLFVYPSTVKLLERVNVWLETLPTPSGSNKRLGRLKLDIELPVRTFGQYVAESEKDSLTNYFVHTNEFEAVLAGRATVFTGRKGTGKTACMQQAVQELRGDRRVLAVPIKPSSYDLSGLLTVLDRFEETSKRDYFLLNLWSYLLVTEIAIRCMSHAESLPAGLGADSNIVDLASKVEGLGIDRESDLSTRLDEAVARAIEEVSKTGGAGLHDISDRLRTTWHTQLLPDLRQVLHGYDRVAVLVDNLDKTWQRGVNFEQLSHFLLSLLVTAGRLQSELGKSKSGHPDANMTLTIFLRTDIYDVMTHYAREPDKINPQTIQWEDEELLIRVLEERYLANRSSVVKQEADALWGEVFCPEVHSLPTRDYFLWRALPRPRDIVFLGNAALTTAINRRHNSVLPQDFTHAEQNYSRFAVEALLVESEAQGFDVEEVLFEFAGLDSTVTELELAEALTGTRDPKAVRDWLIRTSFLGLETRDGSFVHVQGESQARKKLKSAERLAARLDRPLRYRVHPAFRPHLDIRDDDVHVDSDATLAESESESESETETETEVRS